MNLGIVLNLAFFKFFLLIECNDVSISLRQIYRSMTFLNPLVLFGLFAAAIPVILHLLNLRKLRIIEFSTLTFLKELQQSKIRRLKLRQILLLITRTLLIILIVLAFARPAIRGTILGRLGSHAHSTIVFILDDSFSMMGSDEHGELFKQAKNAAVKLIELLKEGDEAFLIKLSDIPQATIDPATHDFTALSTIINESQISSIRRPMEDALRLSAKLLQRSINANKEVYLISDMQQSLFMERNNQVEEKNLSLFDEKTNFFFVHIGAKEIANASIDSIEVTTTILEKDKPATLYTSVRNYSNVSLNNYVVSAYLDGIKVGQRNVSIEPWGSAVTELSIIPKHTGFLKGYIEIENDAIEIDNRRYFTLCIPAQINIAIVSASEIENKFILLALRSGKGEDNQLLFNIQQISAPKLALLNFQNVDVLVCSNVKSFTVNDANRIKSFIENGGGFVLFPGNDIQRENYSSTILSALNISSIENIVEISGEGVNLVFQKVDIDHPLFATIFEKEASSKKQNTHAIESPGISRMLKHQVSKHERTIISMSDGSPFLSEYNFGSGKILFFSVAPTLSWSDFPLKGVFAPLVYRSMIYVSPREENKASYLTGEDPIISLRRMTSQTADKQYKLITPNGLEELIQPITQMHHGEVNRSFSFALKNLAVSGFYEMKNATSPFFIFTANTNNLESDTRRAKQDGLEKWMAYWGISPSVVHFSKPGDALQATILQSRFGVELWKYCIGLALLMAILEMLIARDSRKSSQQT